MHAIADDHHLHALLNANAAFDLDARGTTNHCPMALVALARMGASPERLRAFFDYWQRAYALPAPPRPAPVARSAWRAHRGDARAFHALRLCFEAWLAEATPAEVLAEIFGAVTLTPASIAFHALIRLAYGLEAKHRGEIAAGLAALVAAPLPVEVEAAGSARASAPSAAAGFASIVRATGARPFAGASIVARLLAVTADPRFAAAVLAPPRSPALLDEIACAVRDAYAHAPNFIALHAVTATHAARIVGAALPPELAERLVHAHWYALCAAYAAAGAPLETIAEPSERAGRHENSAAVADWSALFEQAVASNDDHVIKMVYTCAWEDRRAPSPAYRAAAARLIAQSCKAA